MFLARGAQKYDDIALESCLLIVLFLNFAPKQEFSFSNTSSRIFFNDISLNYAKIEVAKTGENSVNLGKMFFFLKKKQVNLARVLTSSQNLDFSP